MAIVNDPREIARQADAERKNLRLDLSGGGMNSAQRAVARRAYGPGGSRIREADRN